MRLTSFSFLLFLVACSLPSAPPPDIALSQELSYKVNQPVVIIDLPEVLEEVSAIVLWKNDLILAIQDEKAIIYAVDLHSGAIVNQIQFGEGLALVEHQLWALRSDGLLFELKYWEQWDKTQLKVHAYPTSLRSTNDVEGLAYDANNNTLLLACKGAALPNSSNNAAWKAIYRFDLAKKELYPEPAYRIFIQDLVDAGLPSAIAHNFSPSDIAIQPLYQRIFIPSATARVLLSMEMDGRIHQIYSLDPNIYEQPEGIYFSSSADFWMASEGNKQAAKLLKVSKVWE